MGGYIWYLLPSFINNWATTRIPYNLACCLVILFQSSICRYRMVELYFIYSIYFHPPMPSTQSTTGRSVTWQKHEKYVNGKQIWVDSIYVRNKIQSILHPKKICGADWLVGDLERIYWGSSGRVYIHLFFWLSATLRIEQKYSKIYLPWIHWTFRENPIIP